MGNGFTLSVRNSRGVMQATGWMTHRLRSSAISNVNGKRGSLYLPRIARQRYPKRM
jgi:hypothetical protein